MANGLLACSGRYDPHKHGNPDSEKAVHSRCASQSIRTAARWIEAEAKKPATGTQRLARPDLQPARNCFMRKTHRPQTTGCV